MTRVLLADGAIDLRLGRWQDVAAYDVVDHLICDPPYSARVHEKQRWERKDSRYTSDRGTLTLAHRGIPYAAWTKEDAEVFVASWAPRVRGWFAILTSHDLVDVLSTAMAAAGRTVFAPVACVQHSMNVRLAGDGPANWTCHLVVSRPKSLARWGALPGAYVGQPHDAGENMLDRSKRAVPGGKPLWLMSAIVRDYSHDDDLVADPFCGGGTTALACAGLRRRCLTVECDASTFEKARARLAKGHTVDMFAGAAPRG